MHADTIANLAGYITRPIILQLLSIYNCYAAEYFATMRKRRELSGKLIAHVDSTVLYCDNIAKLRNSWRIINYI
jgi:hypothetical protein